MHGFSPSLRSRFKTKSKVVLVLLVKDVQVGFKHFLEVVVGVRRCGVCYDIFHKVNEFEVD